MRVYANPSSIVHIGRSGENLATEVVFDITDWVKDYEGEEGRADLYVHQNGLNYLQYTESIKDGDRYYVIWEITNSNTAYAGMGKCELFYLVATDRYRPLMQEPVDWRQNWHTYYDADGNQLSNELESAPQWEEGIYQEREYVLAKSAIYDFIVTAALEGGDDDAPAAEEEWFLKFLELAYKLRQDADQANAAANTASQAATSASQDAWEAAGSASTAKKAREEAARARDIAVAAKTDAETYMMNAAADAAYANDKAVIASNAALAATAAASKSEEIYTQNQSTVNTAVDAKDTAVAAKEAAEDAKDAAEDAAKTAVEYGGKPPLPIGGTWHIWDVELQQYVDSGNKSVLSIVKTYPSVEDMELDVDNREEGDLVIISTPDINTDENSQLYIRVKDGWSYLSDLSGIQGTGIGSIELTKGNHEAGTTDEYTINLTDGTEYTIPIYNGANGDGTSIYIKYWTKESLINLT